MSLQKVDLNLFLVFDAIYQQRNLTRAAEVLCMSQPAVSNALNRLRNSMGDKLFVRATGGVSPTPMAENIVGRVREALQLLESSINEGATFDPLTSTKVFRLSMNDMSETMILPNLLRALQEQAPHVGIECYHVRRKDLELELVSGNLDLALDAVLVAGPQVCMQPVLNERYVCLARKDHPQIGDSISLEEYLALDHLQVSSRRKGLGYEDVALRKMGKQRHVKLRVPHFQVAPTLIANSDLLLTAPYSIACQYDLKILELPFEMTTLDWNLYWNKSADDDQANRWFRELLIKYAY